MQATIGKLWLLSCIPFFPMHHLVCVCLNEVYVHTVTEKFSDSSASRNIYSLVLSISENDLWWIVIIMVTFNRGFLLEGEFITTQTAQHVKELMGGVSICSFVISSALGWRVCSKTTVYLPDLPSTCVCPKLWSNHLFQWEYVHSYS